MNTTLRVLTVIVVIAAIGMLTGRRTPVQGQSNRPNPHKKLQERARAAHQNPLAIRDFTDEIFKQQAPLADAADSLKERVSRCEGLFRQDAHNSINEKQLEKAFNDEVAANAAPSFWKTNESQIKVLRGHRRQLFPSFVEPRPQESSRLSERMAPAEAAYILITLAANKYANPEFQIEPQEWDKRVLARRQNRIKRKSEIITSAAGTIAASGEASLVGPEAALEAGIKSEHSEITAAAHRLLDRIGFQR